MDDRLLSGIVLGGLSCVFCSYGIVTLVKAYRSRDLGDWGKLAVIGVVSLLLGAALGEVAGTLVMAEPSDTRRDGHLSHISPALDRIIGFPPQR